MLRRRGLLPRVRSCAAGRNRKTGSNIGIQRLERWPDKWWNRVHHLTGRLHGVRVAGSNFSIETRACHLGIDSENRHVELATVKSHRQTIAWGSVLGTSDDLALGFLDDCVAAPENC